MKLQKFNTIVSLLCLLAVPNSVTAKTDTKPDPNDDTTTKKHLLEMFRDSKESIPLDKRDKTIDVTKLYRDDCNRPAQLPVKIQRTTFGMAYQGIPTFFRSPVALCPQDLLVKVKVEDKDRIVDIAIMGASLDMGVGQRGTAFAPQAIRTAERINPWGTKIAHPTVGYVDPLMDLRVVDFGDAPIDI
ncbi:MAG: arginase family protein, partial [Psychrosphaera sp.]|nr:arginase family protein [Psychrosphaera sp.]